MSMSLPGTAGTHVMWLTEPLVEVSIKTRVSVLLTRNVSFKERLRHI